jgi:hypothetical protein
MGIKFYIVIITLIKIDNIAINFIYEQGFKIDIY